MSTTLHRTSNESYPTVRRSGLDVLLIGLVTVAASLAGAASGQQASALLRGAGSCRV